MPAMPTPPLPDTPCLRVRLIYNDLSDLQSGSRFYLSYTGSPPTGANCATFAGDVASAWNTWFAGQVSQNFALVEVDVQDIASYTGAAGTWNGSHGGGQTGTALPVQCCINIEYDIARRYRGGKPRMYLPPSDTAALSDNAHWSPSTISTTNTNMAGFIGALVGTTVGSMTIANHVNLSYYKGFANFTTPSGRERAVPTYRATAMHDLITGYATKAVIGSQKRRRTATTP